MRAGLASLTVWLAATVVAFTVPAMADPGDDHDQNQQLTSVNRRLSELAVTPAAEEAPKPARVIIVPTLATTTTSQPGIARLPAFLMGPQVMRMVANFRSVDHFMHYHSHGVDANFWGIFNHGKGLSVKYTRTF